MDLELADVQFDAVIDNMLNIVKVNQPDCNNSVHFDGWGWFEDSKQKELITSEKEIQSLQDSQKYENEDKNINNYETMNLKEMQKQYNIDKLFRNLKLK